MKQYNELAESELGKQSAYVQQYQPEVLFAILRKDQRDAIGVSEPLPFFGYDLWNHYEVSWLNEKGKPIVAVAVISYSCATPYIIESKSMKLYFNTFNNTVFRDAEVVAEIIRRDLQQRVGGEVAVTIQELPVKAHELSHFSGTCLDQLDVSCHTYTIDASLLQTEEQLVEETLYSDLLKSNCLVTSQPDWGSVQISYRGKKIKHASLLQYIVSFRNHNEFHEQCIERIFVDIMARCQPEELTVYGRYTRRGGIDINPLRTTKKIGAKMENSRLIRQ